MDFKLKKSNLNFRVYTASSIPATGTENDICIVSEVPMSNWIMSPDKPSGTPRSDGDVWIQYSVSGSTFNVLKNNAMMIATISAWQYVDGAWVDRDAVSCQGGVWVDWITYLYNNGDECVNITGGWTSSGYAVTGFIVDAATKRDDYIAFTNSTSGRCQLEGTVNKINFDAIRAIKVTYRHTQTINGSALELFIQSDKTVNSTSAKLTKKLAGAQGVEVTETIEIPSGLGDCYIIFLCTNERKAELYSVGYE